MRAQPLSRKWAQRVAAEIYQLRPGADLAAYALTDDERAVVAQLHEPQSFAQLCRGGSRLDPDSLRRLLRRLRADGVLRSLSGETRAVSATIRVPQAAGPTAQGPGAYSITRPSHAAERAGAAPVPRPAAHPSRASDPESEPRRHEQKSGLVRRFLDSVRFTRR